MLTPKPYAASRQSKDLDNRASSPIIFASVGHAFGAMTTQVSHHGHFKLWELLVDYGGIPSQRTYVFLSSLPKS